MKLFDCLIGNPLRMALVIEESGTTVDNQSADAAPLSIPSKSPVYRPKVAGSASAACSEGPESGNSRSQAKPDVCWWLTSGTRAESPPLQPHTTDRLTRAVDISSNRARIEDLQAPLKKSSILFGI